MSKAILVDQQTLVFPAGGKLLSVALADIESAFEEKTDIAVVPTEMLRLVATSEDGLQRQVKEKLQPGMVYCWERLDASSFQVFIMPGALLEALRKCKAVRSVFPYAVAAREGNKGTIDVSTVSQAVAQSGVLTRAGRAVFGGQAVARPEEITKNDVALVDYLGDRPIIVAFRGAEVKTIRALHPDDDAERALTLTLQGVGMPGCPVVTPNRTLADRLRDSGREARVVRLPPDAPAIGLHGMRHSIPVEFHLPDELARMRRRELRRQELNSVIVVGALCTLAIAAAVILTARRMVADSALAEIKQVAYSTNQDHSRLFRERYATILAGRTLDLPSAWVDLELILPPQLEAKQVSIQNGVLSAQLQRRDLPVDQRDPPISLQEIRQAVARSPAWRGAKVSVRIMAGATHLSYSLEKRYEPPSR